MGNFKVEGMCATNVNNPGCLLRVSTQQMNSAQVGLDSAPFWVVADMVLWYIKICRGV